MLLSTIARLLPFILVVQLWGQTETGQITGTVSDSSGHPAAGAAVTLTYVSGGTVRKPPMSSNGEYIVTGLLPGRYSVQVSISPQQTLSREITVVPAAHLRVDFNFANSRVLV